jgi:hypothetical protein
MPVLEKGNFSKTKIMAQESQLENQIRLYAEKRGVLTYKFTSPGNAKVPDRILINESTVFLEVKAPGKLPDDGQQEEIFRINKVGGYATWCDNITDAKELIDIMTDFDGWTMLEEFISVQNEVMTS